MRAFPCLVALVSLLGGADLALAENAKPQLFADVIVKLDDAKLQTKGAGIRTLFVSLYDAASQGPRPYAAMKVDLAKDAKGLVYEGKLDASNVMVMGDGPTPKTWRIKAKLDKDGSAGPDSPGDLIGQATGVASGSKVEIKIDSAL